MPDPSEVAFGRPDGPHRARAESGLDHVTCPQEIPRDILSIVTFGRAVGVLVAAAVHLGPAGDDLGPTLCMAVFHGCVGRFQLKACAWGNNIATTDLHSSVPRNAAIPCSH